MVRIQVLTNYEVHLSNTGFEVAIFYSKFDSFKFDNRYI